MTRTPPPSPDARLVDANNVLLALSPSSSESVPKFFYGTVVRDPSAGLPDLSAKTVYLCGDVSRAADLDLSAAARVMVVRGISHGYDERDDGARWLTVGLGRVPIVVHGLGVYYRRFFERGSDYFDRVCREHTFQSLTESTKAEKAHRTGIYLTPVRPEGAELHFRLLRCSTNLSGPTENFRASDRHIVDALNQEAAFIFHGQAPLNHVLAQVYHNTPADAAKKQAKARISAHADKTKDMPQNGIMAFCTFYDQLEKLRPMPDDAFDYGHAGASGLTRLRFRLKGPAADPSGSPLPIQFTVTLYPDSVFFMPLSTNRLYTHEIQPSELDAARLPTRLGYVVRCSNTDAVHQDGRTFLKRNGELVALEPPTPEGMKDLRKLYADENKTRALIDYGDGFAFSMNEGDYRAPTYAAEDEFRSYAVPLPDNLFAALRASARFEDVGRGRQGGVLVKPDAARGTPLVRTTTRYALPAQRFKSVHEWLSREIQACASLSSGFNNALIEVYSRAYATMGAHSDQALDLADDSVIALFSCYQNPDTPCPPRRLLVESKEPGGPTFEIPLTHNRVVVFSTDTNRRFRHRIVLDAPADVPDNPWLGVTFRNSKTFIRFHGDHASFQDGTHLTLANEEEQREFYRLRHQENKEANFTYPRVAYTLSASDRVSPDSTG
jgi:hypothetical protein